MMLYLRRASNLPNPTAVAQETYVVDCNNDYIVAFLDHELGELKGKVAHF